METLRDNKLSQENVLIENEQKLHQNSLFFGECLDEEIDTVLPQFLEDFKQKEDFKQYYKVLQEKLEFLKKFQKALENKLQKNQMEPEEYLNLCRSCLKANQKILDQNSDTDELNKNWIQKRIQVAVREIKELESKVDQQKKNKLPSMEEFWSSVQLQENTLKTQQTIIMQQQVIEYLQLYFPQEQSIIESFTMSTQKIIKYFIKLQQNKNSLEDPQVIKEIAIPLTYSNIFGHSLEQRNKIIQDNIKAVQQHLFEVQKSDPKLKLLITQQYKTIIEELIAISKKPFQVCPKLEKTAQHFAIKLVNSGVESGQIQFYIEEVIYKKQKKFALEVIFKGKKIDYRQTLDHIVTGSNDCLMSAQLMQTWLGLNNTSDILMDFILHKKNLFSTDSLQAKETLNFSVFENDPSFQMILNFESKSGKIIQIKMRVLIRQATSLNPQISKDVFQLSQIIPQLKLEIPQIINQSENKNDINQIQTAQLNQQQNQQSNKQSQQQKLSQEPFKFRFQILNQQQKEELKQIALQNKKSELFYEFQLKIFSINFLEQILQDLDQQLSYYSKDTTGYLNEIKCAKQQYQALFDFYTQQIEQQQFDISAYKQQLDQFIKIDETILAFYSKINIQISTSFLQAWLEIFKEEKKELEQSINSQQNIKND